MYFKFVVASIDPALNEAGLAQLDLSLSLAEAIPAPFDQTIIEAEGRDLVIKAIFALQDQGGLFSKIAMNFLENTLNQQERHKRGQSGVGLASAKQTTLWLAFKIAGKAKEC